MFRVENQADTSVLETLKVGDTALVQSTSAWGREILVDERVVTKVTPTQIHLKLREDYSKVFDRRTGFSRGDGGNSAIIDPTHPKTTANLERARTIAARNRLDYAIEAYRKNSLNADAVRHVITAANQLAGRLDMML